MFRLFIDPSSFVVDIPFRSVQLAAEHQNTVTFHSSCHALLTSQCQRRTEQCYSSERLHAVVLLLLCSSYSSEVKNGVRNYSTEPLSDVNVCAAAVACNVYGWGACAQPARLKSYSFFF